MTTSRRSGRRAPVGLQTREPGPNDAVSANALPSGVLVVDKPAGPTSHDVVDRVRAALGVRRVGHTGTLDPFATGVLPMCVGKATRLARFLSERPKGYRATLRLGFATTTDDLTGEPLSEPRAVRIDAAAVTRALAASTGELAQVPPAFSAKHREGRRLYELARRGEAVRGEPVVVRVFELRLLSLEGERLEIDVRCSAGTYVRALARDLGESLGCGAHLTGLRRTHSSGFGLQDAVAWDQIPGLAAKALRPLASLLPELPALIVDAAGAEAVRHGRALTRERVRGGFPEGSPPRVRVLDDRGALLALAVPRGVAPAPSALPVEATYHPDVVLLD